MTGVQHVSRSLTSGRSRAGEPRISAPEIEGIVEQAFKDQFKQDDVSIDQLSARVGKVTIKKSSARIQFNDADENLKQTIEVQRGTSTSNNAKVVPPLGDREPDQKLFTGCCPGERLAVRPRE
jgi:hypothetical protein